MSIVRIDHTALVMFGQSPPLHIEEISFRQAQHPDGSDTCVLHVVTHYRDPQGQGHLNDQLDFPITDLGLTAPQMTQLQALMTKIANVIATKKALTGATVGANIPTT